MVRCASRLLGGREGKKKMMAKRATEDEQGVTGRQMLRRRLGLMGQEIRGNDGRTRERVHGEDMQEIKEVGVGAEQMMEALRGYVSE